MTKTPCELFSEDPAAHEAHLRDCAACQALTVELEQLDRAVTGTGSAQSLVIGELPLASWEGAGERSWPLLGAGVVLILAIATIGFIAAGVSPIAGFRGVFTNPVGRISDIFGLAQHVGTLVQRAPVGFHIVIGIAFLAIKAIFVLLLRRSPKGVDVSVR